MALGLSRIFFLNPLLIKTARAVTPKLTSILRFGAISVWIYVADCPFISVAGLKHFGKRDLGKKGYILAHKSWTEFNILRKWPQQPFEQLLTSPTVKSKEKSFLYFSTVQGAAHEMVLTTFGVDLPTATILIKNVPLRHGPTSSRAFLLVTDSPGMLSWHLKPSITLSPLPWLYNRMTQSPADSSWAVNVSCFPFPSALSRDLRWSCRGLM